MKHSPDLVTALEQARVALLKLCDETLGLLDLDGRKITNTAPIRVRIARGMVAVADIDNVLNQNRIDIRMSKLSDLVVELQKKQTVACGLGYEGISSWSPARKEYRDALEDAAPQLLAAAKALEKARAASYVMNSKIDNATRSLADAEKALGDLMDVVDEAINPAESTDVLDNQ